jgi:hypothetical protein
MQIFSFNEVRQILENNPVEVQDRLEKFNGDGLVFRTLIGAAIIVAIQNPRTLLELKSNAATAKQRFVSNQTIFEYFMAQEILESRKGHTRFDILARLNILSSEYSNKNSGMLQSVIYTDGKGDITIEDFVQITNYSISKKSWANLKLMDEYIDHVKNE